MPPAYEWLNRGAFREVREPSGYVLLHDTGDRAAEDRFFAWRDKARRFWPVLCRRCRTEFVPGGRKIVNCPSCRRRSPTASVPVEG